MGRTINILLSSFGGLGLPATVTVPLCADVPVSAFCSILESRLPDDAHDLILSTSGGRRLDPCASSALSSYIEDDSDLLALRLSTRLLGGKGGFGSQLRAAGGRMSNRKNRDRNAQDVTGSSRNLDGRRLRTITEAKNLAAYLATKPEMDKKEKEEKRKRWEAIVEAAERRENEIKNGRKGARLDGAWVEKKEEEEEKTRDAIIAMMKENFVPVEGRTGSESEELAEEGDEAEAEASGSSESPAAEETGGRSFFGWDDEEMSEDESDEDGAAAPESVPALPIYEGKGKGKCKA